MAVPTSSMASHGQNDFQTARRRRELLNTAGVTLFALIILAAYMVPVAYGLLGSLKTEAQSADTNAPILPVTPITFNYAGTDYPIYRVPLEGGIKELALIKKGNVSCSFVDPQNPTGEVIKFTSTETTSCRTLEPVQRLALATENYPTAFNTIDFPRLLLNTLLYALVTMVGTVTASSLVAYGFARFRFRFKNVLFILLMATIILPPQVTLVPTYAFFFRIGWTGTWLPLIVPQFFGNAYNVFLLRQYFLTIPREMEEAAMIDGAGPLRTFVSVILPQSGPALTAVAMFHFFFAWNDYFGPLIYLSGSPQQQPITVGLAGFNGLYTSKPNLILAAAVISMLLPLAIFFLAQRAFMQGIVITGVDK